MVLGRGMKEEKNAGVKRAREGQETGGRQQQTGGISRGRHRNPCTPFVFASLTCSLFATLDIFFAKCFNIFLGTRFDTTAFCSRPLATAKAIILLSEGDSNTTVT